MRLRWLLRGVSATSGPLHSFPSPRCSVAPRPSYHSSRRLRNSSIPLLNFFRRRRCRPARETIDSRDAPQLQLSGQSWDWRASVALLLMPRETNEPPARKSSSSSTRQTTRRTSRSAIDRSNGTLTCRDVNVFEKTSKVRGLTTTCERDGERMIMLFPIPRDTVCRTDDDRALLCIQPSILCR